MAKFTVHDLINLHPDQPNSMNLECLVSHKGLDKEICSSDINRPGMALTGYFDQFGGERMQVIGRGEADYINSAEEEKFRPTLKKILSYNIPCIIFCYNIHPPRYFLDAAEQAGIPILITPLDSSSLSLRLIRVLDIFFAPKTAVHAVFVEVEGMGILIEGESGVGKSETALELLDRGHRLIVDDLVLIKCLNGNTLWGFPYNNDMKHHMEIRGLGIIDIAHVYGMNYVIERKQVEMVFHLENWDPDKNYDRLGNAGEMRTILDVTIPLITIPVKPGRNIPIIIEAAVLNQRLKTQVNKPDDFFHKITNKRDAYEKD